MMYHTHPHSENIRIHVYGFGTPFSFRVTRPAAATPSCCVPPNMASISRITTAIVTGGASGLGRATALRLAGRGMGVVVADVRNEEPFEHDNIRYAETDVRNEIPISASLLLLLYHYVVLHIIDSMCIVLRTDRKPTCAAERANVAGLRKGCAYAYTSGYFALC